MRVVQTERGGGERERERKAEAKCSQRKMKKETQEKRRREKEKNEKDLASLVVVLLEEEATIDIARRDCFNQPGPQVDVRVGALGVFMQSRKGQVVNVHPHLPPPVVLLRAVDGILRNSVPKEATFRV